MTSGIQLVAERVKQLRLERAWQQEQLAEICDVSVRTVQRVENGEACSLETLKAIAAAFDLKPDDLAARADLAFPEEAEMSIEPTISEQIPPTHTRPDDPMRGFKHHLGVFIAVNLLLLVIDLAGSPDKLWFFYPLLGWGIGLASHWFKIRR